MRLAPLIARLLTPLALLCVFACSFPACSKNGPGPNINRSDSDTVINHTTYDSAEFSFHFNLAIERTSNVFNDTFTDYASMIVYVVNGVVKVPPDSIMNFPPVVYPQSGSEGAWSASYIQDDIGEINITAATGVVFPGDTSVALSFTQTATVDPIWNISFMGGAASPAGGDPSPGWPLALVFNPQLKTQSPINLIQTGSAWIVHVYKLY